MQQASLKVDSHGVNLSVFLTAFLANELCFDLHITITAFTKYVLAAVLLFVSSTVAAFIAQIPWNVIVVGTDLQV